MTDSATQPKALRHWHEVVISRDPVMLSELLAEDATFHSPVLFQPQRGRDLTALYLVGAMHVLANDSFQYVRELSGDCDAVLEFTAEVDGSVQVEEHGVDARERGVHGAPLEHQGLEHEPWRVEVFLRFFAGDHLCHHLLDGWFFGRLSDKPVEQPSPTAHFLHAERIG